MLRESQTLTQVSLKFTTTQLARLLISLSPYLKTIIKYQTSLSIQCTLYESFYYIPLDAYHIRTEFITKANYHAVLQTLKII